MKLRHWLSDHQGAFHSSVDQSLSFSHRISQTFAEGKVAFLDISKAYDRVWRDGLLFKLIRYGIRGRMLR
jgi:hypothetical protein